MYFSLAASPVLLYMYDRRCAERIMQDYKNRVSHLAEQAMPDPESTQDADIQFPRKIWIMSSRVPDDFEEDRGNRWFKTYIKPVLYAAGYDYSFLNGTAPGALGRRVSERIRLERIASLGPQAASPAPGEPGYLESLDKRRHARAMGLTVLVGRNTMKEYLWGLKQGWLVDFDAVQEEKGDEGRTQDLKEDLMRDGRFDEDVRPQGLVDVENSTTGEGADVGTSATTPSGVGPGGSSLFPPRSSYNLFSSPGSAYTTTSTTAGEDAGQSSSSPESRSLIVPAASELPPQPPLLILPYDHPLGFLRLWPLKMLKWAFMERFRVKQGCETALAIIQATHPSPSAPVSSSSSSSSSSTVTPFNTTSSSHPDAFAFSPDQPEQSQHYGSSAEEVAKGLRQIQKPTRPAGISVGQEQEQASLEDVTTDNHKKLKPEWKGLDPAESGSKDLDNGDWTEFHYRSSFSETPSNILAARKAYYTELPGRLATARELARRDRVATKEEQKYPPATEAELIAERLAKEKKWRNDFHGWLLTRRGSKVTWDERLASLKVLDLDMAASGSTATIRQPTSQEQHQK